MTIGEALARAAMRLGEAGIERPQAEARILLEAASGRGRGQIIAFPEQALTAAQAELFERMVSRRCAREPVSRILGSREFWSLRFAVGPATLDPRPDSETLVAAVLARIPERSAKLAILDLGTGTGCLLLALLSELPQATGLGVDVDPAARDIAARNAETLGLQARAAFQVGDWARGIAAAFDVIVSNPPYIESTAIDTLAPEVAQYDPPGALDGGMDGLSAYRALMPQAAQRLKPGGLLALEIGAGQGAAVRGLAENAGLTDLATAQDLAGIERCLLFSR
ncbi:peptide chain release factor N(5)-glutamine methyltransferase [Dongia sedimenti]|uniref:Release factor glutamine methyltransferase n=1 Tax=Dongia sedimenti TaxID=3064282 RepID=A0ABU0YU49_9PROT|nr:peptide chain release factor N(5)-glutamine methyltransferase [Rhodospirillaceae bacterium R-7]